MKANIRTICPICNTNQRLLVNFKDYNSKFDETFHTCKKCGEKLLIKDNNKLPGDNN